MYEEALKILKKFNDYNYEAYIVGGYPRDKYLNIESNDIDITTNATPQETKKIFQNVIDKYEKYGNIIIVENNYKYQVTTFRKDKYLDDRKNVKIKYVNTLKEDLYRRDFIINTLCINKDGNYVDLLNAKTDIDKKIIRLIKKDSMKEDPLRILRAIRFATVLNFKIDIKLEEEIVKYGYLISKLSEYRKQEEINKIINSENKEYGLNLIKKYKIDKYIMYNEDGDKNDG